ncbi:MAG: DUF6273 domain-containing protein, partial [Lachnospiraceae bacterium]|nr:DUF6273 domain-containing protein [Lachnospiraceae bacterium]
MLNKLKTRRYNRLLRKGREYLDKAKALRAVTDDSYFRERALKCFARAAKLYHAKEEAPEAFEAAADCCCRLAEKNLSDARAWFVGRKLISGAYEEAVRYLRLAEKYGRDEADRIFESLTGLAENEIECEEFDKAERLIRETEERYDSPKARGEIHRLRFILRRKQANLQRIDGKYAEALQRYKEAEKYLPLFPANDIDHRVIYQNAELCCQKLGDEEGAKHYKDICLPFLPLIDRIGGEKAWLEREDLLPAFLRGAREALENGDHKLAAEYCENAALLYLRREKHKPMKDAWEPAPEFYEVFSLLLKIDGKTGGSPDHGIMHTAAETIVETKTWSVKRRLFEILNAHLQEKATDQLQYLVDEVRNHRISIGSTVPFGSYPQEDAEPGKAMPIEWEVLDVDGDDLLLVSRYALDAVPYQEDGEDVPWDETTLCRWLNGEFRAKAFSEEEQAHIGERGIDCLSFGNLWAYYDNENYGWLGTCGDDETIFSDLLVADGTPYAQAKGLERWHFEDESDLDCHDSIWTRDE